MIKETTSINGLLYRIRYFPGQSLDKKISVDSFPSEIDGELIHVVGEAKIPAEEYDIKTVSWEELKR